ncbi:hypothetical protein IHE45_06G052600 [Dioscorea alata]|uniref:Uncharacterized protein n=1 Tax=Dioscorea alata TaxID=55571 RepID=A0ACB7VWL8_DIOAL|nr:hypothetical protein IHE45_06G052600 [Dioscorea alata]
MPSVSGIILLIPLPTILHTCSGPAITCSPSTPVSTILAPTCKILSIRRFIFHILAITIFYNIPSS